MPKFGHNVNLSEPVVCPPQKFGAQDNADRDMESLKGVETEDRHVIGVHQMHFQR